MEDLTDLARSKEAAARLPNSHDELVDRLVRKAAKEFDVPEDLIHGIIKLEELRLYSPAFKEPRARFRDLVKEWAAKV